MRALEVVPRALGLLEGGATAPATPPAGVPRHSARRSARAARVMPLLVLALSGCVSVGPKTIPRDRFDYSAAITDSWKRQTLLNIIKLRYIDPPIFVDVGQIIAGYSLEASFSLLGTESSEGTAQGDFFALGGSGRYVDRPTITYTPLTGSAFVEGLMTPFPPDAVFSTIQSGWPADVILFACVHSINGLRNTSVGVAGVSPADPEFMRLLELMRTIQRSGAVGLRVHRAEEGRPATLLTLRSENVPEETKRAVVEARELLRLDQGTAEFQLVQGATAANKHEIAVLTRSMMHIMGTMAAEVSVPPGHVAEGRASPGWESVTGVAHTPIMRIAASKEHPEDAFVTVPYRDHWFWIDDKDLRTKRAFSLMMLLFTLADKGRVESAPVVTIPAQ